MFLRLGCILWVLLGLLFASANTTVKNNLWYEQASIVGGHSVGFMLFERFIRDTRMSGAYIDPQTGIRVVFTYGLTDYLDCNHDNKACIIGKLPPEIQKQATWLKINDFDALHYSENNDDYTSTRILFFIDNYPYHLSISYQHRDDNGTKKAIVDQIANSIVIENISNDSRSTKSIQRAPYSAQNAKLIQTTLNAKNLPDWLWLDAPSFEIIPNNRKLLEEAYLELWNTFDSKDEQKLKSLLSIAIEEKAMEEIADDNLDDETPEGINKKFERYKNFEYKQLDYKALFDRGFKMLPFNTDGYITETFAQGRIVRLVSKEWDSPIHYNRLMNDKRYSINHYFAFINGKFRIVR